MSERIIIRGGTVLSLDRSVGNLVSADVLIEDGRVSEIGPGLRARHAETVDASSAIVMPGFVDTHRHAWHSLFRNLGRSATPIGAADVGRHYTPDHVYAATLIGLLGAIEAGITTVVDWVDLPVAPAFTDAARQAHVDSGLRTVFVAAEASWDETRRDQAALTGLVGAGAPTTLTYAYGPRDPVPGAVSQASETWRTARGAGLRVHSHAGTTTASKGVVVQLNDAGMLGEDVTLVHCTNLDDEDLDAIAASKTRVSLAPSVEMTDGYGTPPLQAFIDRGIRPGLGVGSEMEAPGDLFAQMRAANSVQHATLFDLKLAGKGGVPNLLTTRDVIRYGTIDGAASVGLGDTIGSLSPGKRADVVVLRADRPNIAPVNDPIGAVVWGMDTSNVDWVFVQGRRLVENGELVADVDRARKLATTAQREIAAAAGLLADAGAEQT